MATVSPSASFHLARASTLAGFADLTRELGGDPVALWREHGFALADLEDPDEDRYLPMGQVERLLERAAAEFDCPHFALLLGERLSPSMLGLIGFVMQQAPTIGAALAQVRTHFYMIAQGADLVLDVSADAVRLDFVVHDAHRLPGTRYCAELCLSAGLKIIRTLCGSGWSPTWVEFIHAAPSRAAHYSRWFAAPVRFGHESNSFTFPVALLAQPISNADPQLGRVLHTYLAELDARHSDDPVAQVRELIHRALATGDCSAERIAGVLGVHRRSLHRLLAQEGTSYKALLSRVRQDLARSALANPDTRITDVAQQLCYSDTSAFTRAFTGWFGVSPRAWRGAQVPDGRGSGQ